MFSLIISRFLSFSQNANSFLRGGTPYAAYIRACPPLRGGLQHDRGRGDGGGRRVRRQGQPADADGAGASAGVLPQALSGAGHHAGDGDAGHGLCAHRRLLRGAGRAVHPHRRAGVRHRVSGAAGEKPLLPVRQAAAGQPAHGADGAGHPQDRAGSPLRRRGGDTFDEPAV